MITSLSELKGIGKVRLEALTAMKLETPYDVLMHFPRSYPSNRICSPFDGEAYISPSVFRLTVASAPATFFRGGMRTTRFTAACRSCIDLPEGIATPECAQCEGGCKKAPRINILYFNNPYIKNTVRKGETYTFVGTLRREKGGIYLICPTLDDSIDLQKPMRTQYSVRKPLTSKLFSGIVMQLRSLIPSIIKEELPQRVIERFSLMGRAEAVEELHFPSSPESLEEARRRMAFEELYFFARSAAVSRREERSKLYPPMTPVDMKPLYDSLGFELTTGQQNAVNDILSSMRSDGTDIPAMDRLLQGDVGSGKTAVAFASAYEVLKNNYNVLMMAPTEILANQHYEKAKRIFAPLGIETVLITASVKSKERKEAEDKCRERVNGCGVLAIGTHALITDKTNIPDVALVITDEQHRFGVVQRERLREKSLIPHTLMMTATPIPRTMAMFFYSRKDVSVLGELPSGRKPIETVVCSMEEQMKSRVYGFIKKHLDEGGRAYIVCPLISENENTPEGISDCICEYMSASDFFGEEDTALLHGRMTASEKDNAMASFASGEKRVLVTTTVIEVGVDVPEATLMVIENADRFGLAQLHQLRGRVGRGQKSSYCVLMSSNNSEKSRTRLQIMKNERDGMKLAEYDLKTRGPGDFLGVRQSGEPLFELGSFATEEMIEELLSFTDE